VRFVRALGKHRYVAGRLHQIHAFVFAAAGARPGLEDAHAWATRILADPDVDSASRDERLQRRSSDEELVLALDAIWHDVAAREALRTSLHAVGATLDAVPFDEGAEDTMYPALIDAGWELLPLSALEADKHAGVIRALDAQEGDADYVVARFEEENVIPPVPSLYELPLLGGVELLDAFESDHDDAQTFAPFAVWTQGHPVYLDYLLRGVAKVAKLRE
jgi:hypothetical protein